MGKRGQCAWSYITLRPGLYIHVIPCEWGNNDVEGLLADHERELIFPGSETFIGKLFDAGGNCIALSSTYCKYIRIKTMAAALQNNQIVRNATWMTDVVHELFLLTDAANMDEVFRLTEQSSGYKVHFKKMRLPLMRGVFKALKKMQKEPRNSKKEEWLAMIGHQLKLKDHTHTKAAELKSDLDFWRCFGRIYSEVAHRRLTAFSRYVAGSKTVTHEEASVFTIEILALWKAIDVFLDPSFSLHIIALKGDDAVSRRRLKNVTEKLECPELLECVEWHNY